MLRASETLMAAVENFRSEVNQLHSSLRGDLNIGLMNSLISQPHMHITSALRTLRQNSDAVRVHISMSTPGEIERGLLEGRLHMGVLPETNALSGLEYRTLYAEPYFLYCSWEHPLFRVAQQRGRIVCGFARCGCYCTCISDEFGSHFPASGFELCGDG